MPVQPESEVLQTAVFWWDGSPGFVWNAVQPPNSTVASCLQPVQGNAPLSPRRLPQRSSCSWPSSQTGKVRSRSCSRKRPQAPRPVTAPTPGPTAPRRQASGPRTRWQGSYREPPGERCHPPYPPESPLGAGSAAASGHTPSASPESPRLGRPRTRGRTRLRPAPRSCTRRTSPQTGPYGPGRPGCPLRG
jgi:hypothetical protein